MLPSNSSHVCAHVVCAEHTEVCKQFLTKVTGPCSCCMVSRTNTKGKFTSCTVNREIFVIWNFCWENLCWKIFVGSTSYENISILQHRSLEKKKSIGGDGWRGVGVQKRAQKLFRSIRCGCEKWRNYHRTFTSKAVADVFAVFATGKYSHKCERWARTRGMARSIIHIVIIRLLKKKYSWD